MIWILAPFGLVFALFAVYLIVSIFLKDPARPFRMFAAPPLNSRDEESGARSQESEEDQT